MCRMLLQIVILYDRAGRECSAVQSAQGFLREVKVHTPSLIFFTVNKTKAPEQLVVHIR